MFKARLCVSNVSQEALSGGVMYVPAYICNNKSDAWECYFRGIKGMDKSLLPTDTVVYLPVSALAVCFWCWCLDLCVSIVFLANLLLVSRNFVQIVLPIRSCHFAYIATSIYIIICIRLVVFPCYEIKNDISWSYATNTSSKTVTADAPLVSRIEYVIIC